MPLQQQHQQQGTQQRRRSWRCGCLEQWSTWAAMILWGGSGILLLWYATTSFQLPLSNDASSHKISTQSTTDITQLALSLVAIVGSVLLAQSFGSVVCVCLLERRQRQSATTAAQAVTAAVGTSIHKNDDSAVVLLFITVTLGVTALAVCIAGVLLLAANTTPGNDDNTDDNTDSEYEDALLEAVAFLRLLLQGMAVSGAGVAALCSVSLMARVWPGNSNYSTAAAADHIDMAMPADEEEVTTVQREGIVVRTATLDAAADTTHSNPLEEPLLSRRDDNQNEDEDGDEPERPSDDANNSTSSRNSSTTTPRTTNTTTTTITTTNRLTGTRRLLKLAAPHVTYLYAGCIVLLIRLPFSLAMPHFTATVLAAVAAHEYTTARHAIVCLLVAGTCDAALDFWGFFLFGYANQRIVRRLRTDLFAKLLGMEVAFFDVHSSGELASRLNSDCSEMAGDLTWFFRFSIESCVRITGIASYMLVGSRTLGMTALSIVPVVAVINKVYGDWLRRNAVRVQDALAEANGVALECLANVRTVLGFGAVAQECARYRMKIESQYILQVQQLYMTAFYYMAVSTFLINTVVQGILLWVGTLLIEREELRPAILLAFMLYQSQLQNEVLNLMNSYTSLIKSSGAGEKVFGFLDRSPEQPCLGDQSALVEEATVRGDQTNDENIAHSTIIDQMDCADRSTHQYNIRFESVHFRYPARSDNLVLNGFDLSIQKGTTVALVGKSGCGKSTVVSLLQRFYDPNEGRILIDGIDLRELSLLDHRRRIGIVTQDPVLFLGTLYENIIYGCSIDRNVTRADVERAARLANAHDFITDFQDGYSTQVGERGAQLSGGQKQRIAIARALVLEPELLILDEATSSLAISDEIAVQTALDRLLRENQNMTTIVIAHRLRTVVNADKIVVIEDGKVVEQGSHDELKIPQTGLYSKMVQQAGASGLLPS